MSPMTAQQRLDLLESARRPDGKFGHATHTAPTDDVLGGHDDGPVVTRPRFTNTWQARRAELLGDGYVPAHSHRAKVPAAQPGQATDWWDEHFTDGEYGHAAGEVTKMPDDHTPRRLPGRATSGLRRTHRMRYQGADVQVRMPSVTSIRRFARETGHKTFDVPITVQGPDRRDVAGWVRVSGQGRTWDAKAVGMTGMTAQLASESVASLLESRRPSTGLTHARDLLARHRSRQLGHGAPTTDPDSSWIDKVGFDEATSTMFMETAGRQYGYQLDEATYLKVATNRSVGEAYNDLVKHRADRKPVATCDSCGRFYATATHTCPGDFTDRTGDAAAAARFRERGASRIKS